MGSNIRCPHCKALLRKSPTDEAAGHLAGFSISMGLGLKAGLLQMKVGNISLKEYKNLMESYMGGKDFCEKKWYQIW